MNTTKRNVTMNAVMNYFGTKVRVIELDTYHDGTPYAKVKLLEAKWSPDLSVQVRRKGEKMVACYDDLR